MPKEIQLNEASQSLLDQVNDLFPRGNVFVQFDDKKSGYVQEERLCPPRPGQNGYVAWWPLHYGNRCDRAQLYGIARIAAFVDVIARFSADLL